MKRSTIVIDEKLIKAGLKATGLKTRRALVDHALRDLLRRESQKKNLELKGKVHWECDLSELEWRHRKAYKRKPVKQEEFGDWE